MYDCVRTRVCVVSCAGVRLTVRVVAHLFCAGCVGCVATASLPGKRLGRLDTLCPPSTLPSHLVLRSGGSRAVALTALRFITREQTGQTRKLDWCEILASS